MGPRADELRLADNMVGAAIAPADEGHPAGRPGHHPRRQQHDHRVAALRQADGRCCRCSGTSTTTPSGCRSPASAAGCRRTHFKAHELLGAIDELLADPALRERAARVGAAIRERDRPAAGCGDHRARRAGTRRAARLTSVTDFPVVVAAAGDHWRAEPSGPRPSTALLDLLASDHEVPDGFRITRGAPLSVDRTERRIEVDQTNESWVVGDRVVVKWNTEPLVGPHPAPERLRRLADAGFTAMPRFRGMVEWRTPDDFWVPVVTAVDLVPDATDGWTWCLAECRVALGVEHGAALPFTRRLGGADRLDAPGAGGLPDRAGRRPRRLPRRPVLRTPDGELFVIDFDGNPTLPPEERVRHRPAAYDVAGMLVALENVGHVAQHYVPDLSDDDVIAWTEQVQGEFLASYREYRGRAARPRAAGRIRARPDPPGARVRRLPPAALALRARGGPAPKEAVMKPDLFLADLLEKPARLRAARPRRRVGLRRRSRSGCVLLGMGSSHYANLVCAARLRAAGMPAVAELASYRPAARRHAGHAGDRGLRVRRVGGDAGRGGPAGRARRGRWPTGRGRSPSARRTPCGCRRARSAAASRAARSSTRWRCCWRWSPTSSAHLFLRSRRPPTPRRTCSRGRTPGDPGWPSCCSVRTGRTSSPRPAGSPRRTSRR